MVKPTINFVARIDCQWGVVPGNFGDFDPFFGTQGTPLGSKSFDDRQRPTLPKHFNFYIKLISDFQLLLLVLGRLEKLAKMGGKGIGPFFGEDQLPYVLEVLLHPFLKVLLGVTDVNLPSLKTRCLVHHD